MIKGNVKLQLICSMIRCSDDDKFQNAQVMAMPPCYWCDSFARPWFLQAGSPGSQGYPHHASGHDVTDVIIECYHWMLRIWMGEFEWGNDWMDLNEWVNLNEGTIEWIWMSGWIWMRERLNGFEWMGESEWGNDWMDLNEWVNLNEGTIEWIWMSV